MFVVSQIYDYRDLVMALLSVNPSQMLRL